MELSTYKVKTKHGEVELTCRKSFTDKTPEQREAVSNGLGPKGFGWLVPDTIIGINVTPAGDVHDEGYTEGGIIVDKQMDDRIFRDNMIRLVNAKKNQWSWVKKLRMRRIKQNYRAVKNFGGGAFNWKHRKDG